MFALKNLLRRRIRTALTVLGVSVGVATVVALVSVSRGFRSQFDAFFAAGDTHLVLTLKDAADPFVSYLDEDVPEDINTHPAVAKAYPFLWGLKQVQKTYFVVYGVTPDSPFLNEVTLVEGRELAEADTDDPPILVGDVIAKHLELGVGDELEIAGEWFEVAGIYEASVPLYAGGGLTHLETAQEVCGLEGKISATLVQLHDFDPDSIAAGAAALEETFEVKASEPARLTDSFDEFELTDDSVMVFTILAIIVGGIGVMNTMLMSVFERTREIGVLQAIGWGKGLILRQILLEGIGVCLLGGIGGVLLGILGIEVISSIGSLSWVAGDYGPRVFAEAIGIAVLMGACGSIYPAYRAVRITPIEALRYE